MIQTIAPFEPSATPGTRTLTSNQRRCYYYAMKRRPPQPRTWFLLTAATLLLGGCTIASHPDFRLGVPYYAQPPGSFDCGPASVQMWADYDGVRPLPTQAEISSWIGGTSCGASEDAISLAVNHFTYTKDTYWDFTGYMDDGPFMTRQITSMNARTPVIAILDGGLHAGVVNGGAWLEITQGYQWEYVYFHDPLTSANDYYTSSDWLVASCPTGSTCSQIVSRAAVTGWSENYYQYGSSVYDSSGCDVNGSCSPENQDVPD